LQVFANICIDVSTFSLLFEQMQHNIGICVTCISILKNHISKFRLQYAPIVLIYLKAHVDVSFIS